MHKKYQDLAINQSCMYSITEHSLQNGDAHVMSNIHLWKDGPRVQFYF